MIATRNSLIPPQLSLGKFSLVSRTFRFSDFHTDLFGIGISAASAMLLVKAVLRVWPGPSVRTVNPNVCLMLLEFTRSF